MRLSLALLAALALAICMAQPAAAVNMAWSNVGNPGNPADTKVMMTDGTSGYGSVGYNYRIGTYDVTNAQYTEFLNAKDPTGANTRNLYWSQMGSDPVNGGIQYN